MPEPKCATLSARRHGSRARRRADAPCRSSAAARDLDYGAISDPAVRACDALNWSPRTARARAGCYRLLADAGATAAAERAEAAWALGDFGQANDLFRAAAAAAPPSAALRVRWGELYMDSHQPQQALDLFKEALQRDPHDAYRAGRCRPRAR